MHDFLSFFFDIHWIRCVLYTLHAALKANHVSSMQNLNFFEFDFSCCFSIFFFVLHCSVFSVLFKKVCLFNKEHLEVVWYLSYTANADFIWILSLESFNNDMKRDFFSSLPFCCSTTKKWRNLWCVALFSDEKSSICVVCKTYEKKIYGREMIWWQCGDGFVVYILGIFLFLCFIARNLLRQFFWCWRISLILFDLLLLVFGFRYIILCNEILRLFHFCFRFQAHIKHFFFRHHFAIWFIRKVFFFALD